MSSIVWDTETNGLLPELDRIHSLVLRDTETGDLIASCTDNDPTKYPSIEYGLDLLRNADRSYAHNGLGFDLKAVKKVYPRFELKGDFKDTLVIARMRWCHIKPSDFELVKKGKLPGHLVNRHSLEAWGWRLGLHKGEYTDWCKANGVEDPWSLWRPEMQDYCELDTEVNLALVQRIRAAGVSAESVETEMELAAYLDQQEQNGWPFDLEKAATLQGRLAAIRQEAGDKLREAYGSWLAPNGKPKSPAKDRRIKGVQYVQGAEYTNLKTVEFNPGSRDHIAKKLQEQGWKPESYTNTGKPQVDEGSLKGLDFPEASLLREYLKAEKLLGMVAEGKEAWMHHQRLDPNTGLPHIYHRVSAGGTVTHRGSHSKPNVAQVPKVGKPFGQECRELFTVPPGWVQIGADASGLELRCLSHYMAKYDDGAYGRIILEGRNEDGTDIHSQNQRALEGFADPGKKGRDDTKTFIYAYLYGAGDEKLGSIFFPALSPEEQKEKGGQLRRQFEKKLAALGLLTKAVKKNAKEKGWLRLIDGRKAFVRHQHAALNTLLQGTGAVICKRWIVEFNRRLCREFNTRPGGGWDQQWAALGWIHDEVQLAVRPEIADRVQQILVESIRAMTEHFHFRLQLDGEAKTGHNWADCH